MGLPMITVHPIPAFNDNYIWTIINREQGCCVVVDPGDATPVHAFLKSEKLSLVAIFVTHHHPDHTGGVSALQSAFDCPVFGGYESRYKGITAPLKQDDRFSMMGFEFSILEVPGHTLDHIAYYCSDLDGQEALFCGDTLFVGGCGRLFEGDAPTMLHSLKKIASLPPSTRVYCTHEYTLSNLRFAVTIEPDNQDLATFTSECEQKRQQDVPTVPSTIQTELRINPFLRTQSDTVRAAAIALNDLKSPTEEEVFAAIRHAKDNF